ncbi:tetratricopeptide repeat protein [Aerosakkonemataceae cyanobacterium BLCC-F154]|uniref:Tetratricopeptide repeat protein n=1 Tax=Floridaenema fluviatile BLCC-F154 TaxID=3153640 RepID=A0ABV4YG42_9CYAN
MKGTDEWRVGKRNGVNVLPRSLISASKKLAVVHKVRAGVKGKKIFFLCLILPVYFLLLGAADLNEQLDIRINNGTQGESRDEADRLVRLGGQAQQKGLLAKAIPYWLKALNIYAEIGDLEAIGRTYDYLGLAYADLGLFRQAEDALRKRLGVAKANNDLQGQIVGLNNVGSLLLKRRNISGAKTSFNRALSLARATNSPTGIGLSLNNLGLAAASQGDYNQAIKRYEEALIYRSRASDPVGEANTYNNLGDAYRATDNFWDTIRAYGAALRVARFAIDRPNQFRAIDGLVDTYNCAKNYTRTLDLLEERLKIARASENPYQELKSLRLLSQFYRQQGKNMEALMVQQQAICLAQELSETQLVAELLGELIEIPVND